jgi:transposase
MMANDKLDLFRKYKEQWENDKDSYFVESTKCGVDEWSIDENPKWDLVGFNYRIRRKKSKSEIKKKDDESVKFIVTLWTDEKGHVYADNKTKSYLKSGAKLSIKVQKAHVHYYDHFNSDVSEFDYEKIQTDSMEADDIDTNDENSLRMIYRFISSIASGIRRPSDSDQLLK